MHKHNSHSDFIPGVRSMISDVVYHFVLLWWLEWLVFDCLLCFYNANMLHILHKRYYFRARILGNVFWSTMSSPDMPLKIESFGCGKIAFITF